MAGNRLANAALALTTVSADVFECPAEHYVRILTIHVANIDGANNVDITVSWTDDSNADAEWKIMHTVTCYADDSLNVGCGLILEAGDKVKALASANGDAHLTLALELIPIST